MVPPGKDAISHASAFILALFYAKSGSGNTDSKFIRGLNLYEVPGEQCSSYECKRDKSRGEIITTGFPIGSNWE